MKLADDRTRTRLLVEEAPGGRPLADLVGATGISRSELESAVKRDPELILIADRAVTQAYIEARRQKLIQFLTAFHAKHPSAPGAPVAVARLGLPTELATVVFEAPLLKIHGNTVSLRTHEARLSSQESQTLGKIEEAFRQAGFQPPAPAEVLQNTGADPTKARGLLETLIKSKKLVRISEALIFHAEVLTHISQSLSSHKGRRFSVPEFKDRHLAKIRHSTARIPGSPARHSPRRR